MPRQKSLAAIGERVRRNTAETHRELARAHLHEGAKMALKLRHLKNSKWYKGVDPSVIKRLEENKKRHDMLVDWHRILSSVYTGKPKKGVLENLLKARREVHLLNEYDHGVNRLRKLDVRTPRPYKKRG